jgi:hypothetical protein
MAKHQYWNDDGTPNPKPATPQRLTLKDKSRCVYCQRKLKRRPFAITRASVCNKCGRTQPWSQYA